jgi:hypothetical protein
MPKSQPRFRVGDRVRIKPPDKVAFERQLGRRPDRVHRADSWAARTPDHKRVGTVVAVLGRAGPRSWSYRVRVRVVLPRGRRFYYRPNHAEFVVFEDQLEPLS